MNSTYYMNIHTGTVDTLENWKEDGATPEDFGDLLIEVCLEGGDEVPEDFNPCYSADYTWVEVEH